MKSLLVLAALSVLARSASAVSYSAVATGRVLCNVDYSYLPIKDATVKLMDKDTFVDDTFGTTKSDGNGNFYVSGSVRELVGNPEPYIKVQYQYTGSYGSMEVNGPINTVRDDRSRTKPYASALYFGDIVFSGDDCRAYVKFYDALADYYNRTGESFPIYPLHIRTKAILDFGGVPYAEIKTISIPEGYPITTTTAIYQLGHIIRHSLDGGAAHLLKDVVRFNYGGPHQCGTVTNAGQAFDEGWGEFWAGGCNYYYYGYYQKDYNIIGNVAGGLRRLQRRCGFSDRDMMDVLRRNPGGIHSFEEYEQASYCLDYNSYQTTGPPAARTTTYAPFGITGYEEKAQEENKPFPFGITGYKEKAQKENKPFPFGIRGYEKEAQEESEEERVLKSKEMIQEFLKLLESQK